MFQFVITFAEKETSAINFAALAVQLVEMALLIRQVQEKAGTPQIQVSMHLQR